MRFCIEKTNASAVESSSFFSPIYTGACALLLLASMAWTSDATTAASEDISNRSLTKEGKQSAQFSLPLFLDTLHFQAGAHYVNSVQWLDDHFKHGDDPKDLNHSTIRVQTGLGWSSDQQSLDPNFRLRSRLHLPKLNRKLNLIMESASEEALDSIMEGAENSFSFIQRRQTGSQGLGLGLRYLISESALQNLNLDIGVRARFPIQVFLRGNFEKNVPLGKKWSFSYRQNLFGVVNGVSGTSTELNLRKPINQRLSYRLSQILRYSETSQGVEYDHTHSFFRSITESEAVSLYLGVSGDSDTDWKTRRIGYGLQYRRPFLRPWIQGILDPGIHHLRENNWKVVYSALIGAEVTLGNPRALSPLHSISNTVQP